MTATHRNSIFIEDAEILSHQALSGQQHILRVQAPKIAARAQAGCFAHLNCDPQLPLRRPMSVMRVDPTSGWVEFLYKNVGKGSALLAEKVAGQTLSIMGPIGQGFSLNPARPLALLLGGGVGIPPMVFLADQIRSSQQHYQPLILMGSEVPFPFTPRPSQIMVPGIPDGVIGCMPLMEDWGLASRLASLQGWPGCFDGYITDLARAWLESLVEEDLNRVSVFSCGPGPMLRASAQLAADFKLPCQVSLEEHMACATGGCAGCTILINTEHGPAMRRACVDGPVFESSLIDWQALPA